MPETHTQKASQAAELSTRKEAAARIRADFGVPCTAETLATKAWSGDGPVYRVIAGRSYYDPGDIDDWARSRISEPVRRASDLRRSHIGEAA